MKYLRDAVEVGDWYVADDYDIYERTPCDPCPDGDHPMCHDDHICEVDDILWNAAEVAKQIAAQHNLMRRATILE